MEKSELFVKICRLINTLFIIRLSFIKYMSRVIVYIRYPRPKHRPTKGELSMQKTLKRKTFRWYWATMRTCLFFAVLLLFTGPQLLILAAILFFLIVGTVLLFCANRCPYCGTFFRGGGWSKPHAGYCNKCGKLMEYDDTVAEREYWKNLKED